MAKEHLFVSVDCGYKKLIIANIYRSPCSSTDNNSELCNAI